MLCSAERADGPYAGRLSSPMYSSPWNSVGDWQPRPQPTEAYSAAGGYFNKSM